MITDLIAESLKIVDKYIPDPEQRAKAQYDLAQLEQQKDLAEIDADKQISTSQAETNTAEASNMNLFVSGWRPAIGWVCGLSLTLYYVPQFIAATGLWINMCLTQKQLLHYPVDINDIITLTLSMLGMGGLRTIEKFKGVARS